MKPSQGVHLRRKRQGALSADAKGAILRVSRKMPEAAVSLSTVPPSAVLHMPLNMDRLLQELTSLRAENAQLRATSELAFKDPLTGLRNRRYLAQRLEEELSRAQRGGVGGSLLLLDLNDFKQVNDTHGHNAGDQLLCFVAELLEETMRTSDVCCRTGGDEFVVLLVDTGERGAQVARRRLLETLEELNRTRFLKVHLSVGSASWPTQGDTAQEILHAADVAMYQHKRATKAEPQIKVQTA